MGASREAIAFITKGSRCRGCFQTFFYVFVVIELEIALLIYRDPKASTKISAHTSIFI